MTETIKGEVPFTAAGSNWKLLYDFNALCTIEQDLEVDVDQLGERLGSPSMIRSVFRIGLEAHHGEVTDIEAGRLIHSLGAEQAAKLVGRAFELAFPEAAKSAEGNARKRKSPGASQNR